MPNENDTQGQSKLSEALEAVTKDVANTDKLENLMKVIEELPPPTVGTALKITKTDKIKVRYANMAIVDLSVPFLYQVMEPIAQVHQIYKTAIAAQMVQEINNKMTAIDRLKQHILNEYRSNFTRKADRDSIRKAGMGWLIDLSEVELIECDLLVPRAEATNEQAG